MRFILQEEGNKSCNLREVGRVGIIYISAKEEQGDWSDGSEKTQIYYNYKK